MWCRSNDCTITCVPEVQGELCPYLEVEVWERKEWRGEGPITWPPFSHRVFWRIRLVNSGRQVIPSPPASELQRQTPRWRNSWLFPVAWLPHTRLGCWGWGRPGSREMKGTDGEMELGRPGNCGWLTSCGPSIFPPEGVAAESWCYLLPILHTQHPIRWPNPSWQAFYLYVYTMCAFGVSLVGLLV